VKPVYYKLLPTLNIHSWGGLGSQLYTAQIIMKLQARYSGRRLRVVFHTSGVTRRITEFDFNLLGVNTRQVDDFKARYVSRQNTKPNSFLSFLQGNLFYKGSKRLKLGLERLRFICHANNDASFDLIKPWTFALRGHYTELSFDGAVLEHLYKILFASNLSPILYTNGLVIHYRLGDLLSLPEKAPINPNRIESLILKQDKPLNLTLLSDSPVKEFRKFVASSQLLRSSQVKNLNAIETLQSCIHADTFIGTNAKLSLWSAIFRLYIFKQPSFLPSELISVATDKLGLDWY
jgi:hypothetical protein